MAYWFPSREWLAAYRERLNDNETYETMSEGWGVDFEGDFVFEITDLPIAETTIGDLPEDLSGTLRENLASLSEERIEELIADAPPAFEERFEDQEHTEAERERFISALCGTTIEDAPRVTWPDLRSEYPEDLANLLDQLERYLDGSTVYTYLDLYDGRCRTAEVLEQTEERNAGFVLTAPYSKWNDLIDGADVIESVMSQDMSLDGSITNVILYPEAAQELGDTAGRIETNFLF